MYTGEHVCAVYTAVYTGSVHIHVHKGTYMAQAAQYTAVYTAVCTGRVHGREHDRLHGRVYVYGLCTQPCIRPVHDHVDGLIHVYIHGGYTTWPWTRSVYTVIIDIDR